MLGSGPESGSNAGHHCEGDFNLPTKHVAHLGGVVDQLVHTNADEVYEHELGHGPETGGRGSDGCSNESSL